MPISMGFVQYLIIKIVSIFISECSAELCRARANLGDANDQLDVLKGENKNLAVEIKDLLEQIGDGARSLHEVERDKRRYIILKAAINVV